VADKTTKAPFPPDANVGALLAGALGRRGLFTRLIGETICLAPPLVTTEQQIDRIIEVIGAAVAEVVPE
jgi:adenosylmethionine-8-amino-7-oxononanoate aminotransferase